MNSDEENQSFDGNLSGNSLANLTNSSVEDTFVRHEQEQFYGKVMPTPSKQHEPAHLPPLDSFLVVQKKRSGSAGSGIVSNSGSNSASRSIAEDSSAGNKVLVTPTRPPPLRVLKRSSTPGKKRNFTSPLLGRVPSLSSTPIPDLSLTGDGNHNISDQENEPQGTPNLNIRKVSSPSTVRNFSNPMRLSSWSHPLSPSHRVQPVPMKSLLDDTQIDELKELDIEIKRYEKELDNLKKVKRYRDNKDDEKLTELVNKWRKAAQMASNYLFNEANIKIEKMGGITEYRKKQVESQLRRLKNSFDESVLYKIENFIESPEFQELSRGEKKEIIDKRDEWYEMSLKIENGELETPFNNENLDESGEECLEFTMKELFKQLNQSYELVFPNGV